MKLNVGDKIMITNVDGIYLGGYFWRDGDVVEVLGIEEGDYQVETLREKSLDDDAINGKNWFYIDNDETYAVAKILPPNTQKEELQ